MTAPHEWVILSALASAALGLAAWALLGNVERDITGECALALAGERYPVVSGTVGRVVEVYASEGDAVEAGQPLARVQLHELDHEVSVAQARVALIERHIEAGDDEFLAVLLTARAELMDLEARRESGGHIVSPYAGEIIALNLRSEQEVTEGGEVATVRSVRERRFEAIAAVSEEDAERLEPGMESRVILPAGEEGGSRVLEAEVAQVSDAPETPVGAHLLKLALREPALAGVNDGDTCHLRVVLSRESPISLLGSPAGSR